MLATILKLVLRKFAAAAGAVVVFAHVLPATAQTAAEIQKLFGMASHAITTGDYKTVVKQMSGAIRSNKLSDRDIAIALYFRGVALERARAPAQAISDLTSAIWLTGLDTTQRARALASRGLAYRAVGMDARANADLKQAKKLAPNDAMVSQVLSGGGSSPPVAAPSMSPQGIPMPMMPGVGPGGLPGQQAGFGPTAQLPQVPVGNVPVSAMPEPAAAPKPQQEPKQVAALDSAPAAAPEPPPAPAAAPEPAPTPEPAPAPAPPRAEFPSWATSVSPEAESGGEEQSTAEVETEGDEEPGRLKKFFGSLWGSDDETDTSEGDGGARRAVVATAEWSKTTKVEEIENSAGSGAGRSYRIQLASSRSEDEARTLWKRISSQYSGIVGDREPIIEKTELGTLGTFYRLQLGPFDDKRQSLQLCNSFKRSGVECFLVTR